MLMRKLLSARYGLENEYAKQLQDRSLLGLQAFGLVINHMAGFVKAAKTRVIVNMCATASKTKIASSIFLNIRDELLKLLAPVWIEKSMHLFI